MTTSVTGDKRQGTAGRPRGGSWLAACLRAWEPWGVVALLVLSTLFLLRGWLLGPLPNAPRQEILTELHITYSFLDDLQAGRLLAAWNPREFAGYPWLRFLAYPLYWGLAAVAYAGRVALTDVLKGFYLLVFLGSALAMYAYARRLVPGRIAPALAAIVYQWLPFHAHVGGEFWIHSTFWAAFPLVLYAIERMVAAPRGARRYAWSLVLGALLAALVVISIEYTVFAAPFVAIYVLVREGQLIRAGRETVAGSLARLATLGAVALGLAAFFVWPALTSMATVGINAKHAAGSTFSDELLSNYALTPTLVLYAVAKRTHLAIPYGALPAFATAFWSVAWYPGVVLTGLVLAGLAAAWRQRRLGLPVALLALALVMALGPNLPGNPVPALPVLGRLTPFRAVLFAAAFGSVVAGLGGQWLLAQVTRRPNVSQLLPGRQGGVQAPTTNLGGAEAPATNLGRVLLAGLLVALVLADFAPSASAFYGVERYFSPAEEAAQAWLRAHRGDEGYRLWEVAASRGDEYRGMLDVTRTGWPRFWGYYDNGAPLHTWELFNWCDLATVLRLSSVRYALVDASMADGPRVRRVVEMQGWQRVDWGRPEPVIFEDPRPLPYARAYPAAALYVGARPEEALRLLPALAARGVALVSGDSPYLDDYGAEAVAPYQALVVDTALERQPGARDAWLAGQAARVRAPASLGDLPPAQVAGAEAVRWQRPGPEEVRVDVDLAEAGLVTIAESWYPGWQVTVDGRPAPLLRANYAFQGVWVPAGAHRVVFRYQVPPADRLAGWISVVAAVAVTAALVWLAMRRARAESR